MTLPLSRKDRLYLLPPGFADNGRHEYCPECAEIWGLLAYYPAIREALNIIYQPIAKPRTEMVEAFGAAHQNCPTFVLSADSPIYANCGIEKANGHHLIGDARNIGRYWAQRFGTAVPRGTAAI